MKSRSLCLLSWLETDSATTVLVRLVNGGKPAHMVGNCEKSVPTSMETVEGSSSSMVERRHF